MLKNNFSFFLLFLFGLLSFQHINAQLSKKHFIPPLTYAETGNANPEDQFFYISTPSNQNVSFRIKQVGFPTNDITGVVSSTSPQEIAIGNGDSQLFVDSRQTSVVFTDKGYIIEAEDVIYVSIRVSAGGGAQAGALISKGSSALGKTFRAGMFTNENPQTNYLNFISVMASENNTVVNFDDLPAGISIKNYSGALPISNIILNEGESYVVATNAADNTINRDALIGTLVTSDKEIVVNIGSANGSFHNGGGRDYGIDQIVDVSKIGSEYIFVKGDGSDGWENALIVAHEDNTTININGNGVTSTINAGEYFVIEGDNFNANGNMHVQTSKPVFAYQGIGANTSEANQGLFFVPPLSCENRGKVDNIPNIESIGTTTFTGGITIVTNKGATVNINSQPIANFSTSGPFDVDGNANYVTYKVTNLTGNISIESSEELYCAYFNQNGAATSGSFYSGFPSAPEINFDATVSALGNCIPNVTLKAANTDLFDTFEWFYDDETGGGFIATGVTAPTLKPTQPGKYKLKATIICTMSDFESIEVPVSICPDDYDGDTIIDNLDDDIDNDGILNCDESIGNANINITDINNPSITFQDNSTNSTIISSSFSQNSSGTANTFSGQPDGNFVSTLNAENISNLKYELNFTQNINFELTQASGANHTIVNGEFFIVKIGPNNKNITLLDPDNNLLVDTNFDGIFESGITTISASEIHFTFNPSPTGTTPFKFVANQVNNITFEHKSNSISATSIFNGNLLLTCFSRDSDNDGIEDMFDLDADNDGIPDAIETANDTDNDGVLNYLDLDADNDGIYDSTEAGHNLDTNFDGIVDNANTLIGANGLADNLETTPDNKTLSINYIITDTDADNNFNFLELDADNDNCNDVIEAGFTDENDDGILGNIPLQVDTNGKVINTVNGYTNPNANYTTSAPIVINTPFNDFTFCENSTSNITIDSNADGFQWQVSTDTTTWNNVNNNSVYNGATSTALQIISTPLTFNNNQYRVVLNRNGNSCNFISNSITLTVNPLPIPKENPTELKQCDSDPDKQTTFNLTLVEENISDNPKDTFQYFETETDAISGTPEVTDKTSYFVDTTGEAWVRTISEFGCFAISKINLTVSFTPNEPYEETFISCDDFLDEDGNDTTANSDTDGITNFDFSIAPSQITTDPDVEVEFYETEDDRTKSINKIRETQNISQYRNKNIPNTTGNRFPIFYKLISKSNNDCEGLGRIYLQVNAIPLANPVADLELCDDALSGNTTDGENININLRDNVPTILGTTQTEADYIVTFHTSQNDADDVTTTGITNDTNFRNTAQAGFTAGDISEQTIFVRVLDRNANPQCKNTAISFKIIVNPIPEVSNTITPLAVCDVATPTDSDPRNRIAQSIDLTSKNIEILNGRTNHRVAYYATQQHAVDGTPEITNPSNFQNNPSQTAFPSDFNTDDPGIQTIFFAVIDQGGNMCRSVFSTYQLLIYPEPNIPINISDYTDCDNTTDTEMDDTNGRNGDISLKNKIPEILANYQPAEFPDFDVTFYTSLAEAESGDKTLALDEDKFENSINNQTIYVRVENTKNTPVVCVHTRLSFKINIIPLPEFTVTGEDPDNPQILCLNYTTPHILEAENPASGYDYEWTDKNGTVLGTDQTQIVDKGGEYTVKATNTTTTCSRSRTIYVKESEKATLLEEYVTIIDESNNIGSQDNISIFIDTIKNSLGKGDYQFAIRNDDNGERIPFAGFQDEPLFENLEGGVYTIIVNDKNGCIADETLQISVIQFPKFFTPNGDGKNDTWVVKGANKDFYPNASINIFDRYGKLVAQIPIDSQGWNGTYNGKVLSSDDYWYNVQLIPADPTKQQVLKKGHFSLLRK
ncbi:T9SS type B sorting domain-containing protein [Polaribacter pectinis]|uniref:T9SS type B sorting domain-containing protein n=1 Tax=Polaribacter pectinis TaxID=2738844 RepID=A0A7G9LDZ9_9FLAO|nr:T9SS type B sorting domain-containing protein [Polaribacter pectinis]QNM86848.1 T9SS type B sorting domain-containing protein [Polaribacter pectinis]